MHFNTVTARFKGSLTRLATMLFAADETGTTACTPPDTVGTALGPGLGRGSEFKLTASGLRPGLPRATPTLPLHTPGSRAHVTFNKVTL